MRHPRRAVVDGGHGPLVLEPGPAEPDLQRAGGEAALEEDQRERGDADGPGDLVVVEVQPAESVGAQREAEPEHADEAGDAQAVAELGDGEAGDEQRADGQDELPVLQRLQAGRDEHEHETGEEPADEQVPPETLLPPGSGRSGLVLSGLG